jgi:hypothetical protein
VKRRPSPCRIRQRALLCASVIAAPLLLRAPRALADDGEKLQCIDAHEQAQIQRHDGHLRSARRSLFLCTRSVCPSVVQKECGAWLEQVNGEQPTVVFSVRDEHGADATGVRVSVDGEPLVERLDGRPTEVDPGEHTFRFELASGKSAERRVLLREGEKDRPVSVDLGPAPAPPSTPPSTSPPHISPQPSSGNTAIGVVVGAVGLAALGGAVAFTIAQNNNASNAKAACPSGCVANSPNATQAESDVSSAKSERVWEGVSFGVAGAAIGVASYFLIARPWRVSAPASGGLGGIPSAWAGSPAAGLELDASPHGGWLGWRARF